MASLINNVQRSLSTCQESVIVIGAGAAGLTAARDILQEDDEYYCVTVLEASDRIGGRLKKDDQLADFPIDLGGEWIHVRNFKC